MLWALSGSRLAWRVGWSVTLVAWVGWAVASLGLLHFRGQTAGKALTGLRIVRADGSRGSTARLLFARELPVALGLSIPFLAPIVWLGSLGVFGERRRCLHDAVADTIVVDVRSAPKPEEPSDF
jgi:uncharacterized RDD family membrane protein YckC